VEQVLANLALRLRARAIELEPDDPAVASVVAEAAGPLRAGAAAIRELQGHPGEAPREALAALLSELPDGGGASILESISRSRTGEPLSTEIAVTILFSLSATAGQLSRLARGLS
jgi:hypothetical protein